MKEQFPGINVSFYLEKVDKLCKLQHHFCEIHMDPVDSLVSTIHIFNQ